MSIDITFFAFNESRADSKWTQLRNFDLKNIAATHQTKSQLEDQLLKIKNDEYAAQTAEAYLNQQGIDAPDDTLIFNTESAIERGEIEWPPAVSEEQNRPKKEIERRLSELLPIPSEIDGTNFLYALWPDEVELSWLKHEHTNRSHFLYDLVELDLNFGSVSASPPDANYVYSFMKSLLVIFCPELTIDEVKNIEHLFEVKIVQFFERISKAKIFESFQNPDPAFLRSIEIDNRDLSWFPSALVDFAFEIKPIAKDLKNTGGRLIVGGNGSELEDAELARRADKHFDSLLARFPWINDQLVDNSH